MRPPVIGPTAPETLTVAPNRPKARPRSAPWNICWISAEFWGARQPAAIPCARRATTSSVMEDAAPAAALNTTKAPRDNRKIRRLPIASPTRPAVTSARAKARAYPDTTHWTEAAEACKSRCMDGSATATMVTSSRIMNPATRVTHRARHRLTAARSADSVVSPLRPAARTSGSTRAPSLPARSLRCRRASETMRCHPTCVAHDYHPNHTKPAVSARRRVGVRAVAASEAQGRTPAVRRTGCARATNRSPCREPTAESHLRHRAARRPSCSDSHTVRAPARNNRPWAAVVLYVAAEGTVSPGLTPCPWGRSFG